VVAPALVVAAMVGRIFRRAALAIVVLAGCRGNQYAPPPPPEVTVAQPVQREVTTYNEFPGQTVAVESVELRARVQGYLQSMHFTPGGLVKQNDLLFVIEPTLYQTRVDQADADVKAAEASARAAEEQLAITRAIFERNAGSRVDLVAKMQTRDQAVAALARARATLEAARLDLAYTHIYAPVAGRIDRNYVDVGNLVGAGEATVLATLVQQDPIYAYFQASERAVLEYRAARRRGETVAGEGERNKAYMAVVTEQGYPHEGEVDFVSNRVDPSTGTLEIRAIFPNPDGTIVPGLFVRVRLPFQRGPALLVPDEAVQRDQGGRYVLVIDERNVAQRRRVELGSLADDGLRVALSGLTPTDRVVVNGIQRARPGSTVKPVEDRPTPEAQAAR
jgi:RND family efflux transporter MFP subunit